MTIRLPEFPDEELRQEFPKEFQETMRTLQDMKRMWCLLLDVNHSKELSPDIQCMLAEILRKARQNGLQKYAIVARKSLPFLWERLANDTALKIHFYFQSENDAVRWLSN
ncbi:hypothetical protein GF348_16990 [candidate division KSB3 bacterium]|nr:hypothetical protein [candidate division KSB3 bacterium]